MKKITTLSLITAAILGVNGCGGGGSTSSNSNSSTTGNVGDGYIQGAYVCHDSNNNMDCLDETYAITDANGAFTLSNYDASQDLLVQIPVGAVDNGPFADGSTTPRPFTQQTWYYYPAQAAPANGPIFVGPLSTLVFAQQEAMPGMSVEDATNTVASSLGIDSSSVMSNYLESNSSDANSTHFVAELVGSTLSNYPSSSVSGTTGTGYNSYVQDVLSNANGIGTTALNNNPTTYNTNGYNGVTTTSSGVHTPLNYTAVSDVCNDLKFGYFAFEDWDPALAGGGGLDREHKTLYTIPSTSTAMPTLQFKIQDESNNQWTTDTTHTTTEATYLQNQDKLVIDMANVNSTTVEYTAAMYQLPFPAERTACNGSSATFKIGAINYNLYVAQADISGVTGATLPQGPTLNPLISSVTFGTGDKIYKASIALQNDAYTIKKEFDIVNGATVQSPLSDYVVYDGSSNPIVNSSNLTTLLTVGSRFIVNNVDANNHESITIATLPVNSIAGTVTIVKTVGGTAQASVTRNYSVQTHNGTPFMVVENYYGVGQDLFLGKVLDAHSSYFVFGTLIHPGSSFYLTEGGNQHGDIMDDIMINASARDRILNAYNTQNATTIPTPTF